MTQYRVTIGIPFYNAEATLADAIRSVFAQTFQDWELVLVDDGSRDGSLKIARAVQDRRVRVIADGRNRELSYRLNQIAEVARGRYVARMDADDLMHPERLQRQVKHLDSHPALDVVGTRTYTIDAADRLLGARGLGSATLTAQAVLSASPFIHPTVMARAEWYRRYSYDGTHRRAEDRELWCRAFLQEPSKFGNLNEPLLFYREDAAHALGKCLQTHAMDRTIIRRYGPRLAGRAATWNYIAKSYLKSGIWRAAHMLGCEGRLIRRRSLPLSNAELIMAGRALQNVLSASVPGLSVSRQRAA